MRERWRQSKWSCDPMEQTPSTAESVNKVSQRGEPHSMGRKAPNFCRRRTKWSKKTVQEELDSRTAAEQGQRHGTQELPLRWDGRIGWRCARLHSQCSGSRDRIAVWMEGEPGYVILGQPQLQTLPWKEEGGRERREKGGGTSALRYPRLYKSLITDFFSKADEMHKSKHDPEGLTDSLVSLKIQKGKWTPVRRRTTKNYTEN